MRARLVPMLFSIACGVACVVLVAMWLRSYYYVDSIQRKTSISLLQLESEQGYLQLRRSEPFGNKVDSASVLDELWQGGFFRSHSRKSDSESDAPANRGFRVSRQLHSTTIVVPYWSIVLTLAALSAVTWFGRRYRMRTLILGAMLIAFALGYAVYANKK